MVASIRAGFEAGLEVEWLGDLSSCSGDLESQGDCGCDDGSEMHSGWYGLEYEL